MNSWFDDFTAGINGGVASSDLIGAHKANAQRALEHYRYQHTAKIREAVEATFPDVLRLMNKEWDECWDKFLKSKPASPRSLDFYPEVFLNYFLSSDAPAHIKEVARFEYAMDIYPWTHVPVIPASLDALNEDSSVELFPYEVLQFSAPVTGIYQEKEGLDLNESQAVLIWLLKDGVRFRSMQKWELEVMAQLHLGIGEALTAAPDDGELVSSFFKWLGESGLIAKTIDMVSNPFG